MRAFHLAPASHGLRWTPAPATTVGRAAFFLLLNVFFGLGGRYDMTLAALGAGFLLWRLQRRPA